MASFSVPPPSFSLIGCLVTEKLGKNNYTVWCAHVLSALCGARLAHLLDEKMAATPSKQIAKAANKPDELSPNPKYDECVGKDQTVFNYLFASISKDIRVQVSNCTTSVEIWKSIQER